MIYGVSKLKIHTEFEKYLQQSVKSEHFKLCNLNFIQFFFYFFFIVLPPTHLTFAYLDSVYLQDYRLQWESLQK